MSKTTVLLVVSALAACGMLAAAGLVWPTAVQFGVTGAGAGAAVMAAAYLFFALFAPGFAAGVVWGTNRGKAPRPALAAIVLGAAAGLLALGFSGVLLARFAGTTVSSEPWWSIHRALWPLRTESVVFAVANAWSAWLGIIAGRRVRSPLAARRLTSASLAIALVLGVAWLGRYRVLPAYGVWHTLRQFERARTDRDYAAAAKLFTSQYLKREFGSPPFAPKYAQACRREQAELRSDDNTILCFHYPATPRLRPVAGSNSCRVQIQYHYKGSPYDRLSPVRWTWDVVMTPRGCDWLIADMQLNRDLTRQFWGEDYEFTQGPAGTVSLLSAPRLSNAKP